MLLVLLAIILAMGGVMLLNKAYAPQYGLDLAAGTTVTLQPITPNGSAPTEESLDLAVNIIRDRVNGSGISDAEVAKSGDNIVISVPGVGQEEVVKLVGTTAELRFRQVMAIAPGSPQPPVSCPPRRRRPLLLLRVPVRRVPRLPSPRVPPLPTPPRPPSRARAARPPAVPCPRR
ncbi:hypothetical protein ACFQX6_21220 [Streptosporangium lutulentum]